MEESWKDREIMARGGWEPPTVAVIGVGARAEECSPQARALIDRAQVLVGGTRLLELFEEHPGRKIPIRSPLDAVLQRIQELSETRRVVVLASGDPLFFGIGRRLLERFGRDRLFFVPAPTAVQALCARLGTPWDDVRVVSLHGREPTREWMWHLRMGTPVALLTDARNTPAWAAEQLWASGLDAALLWVGEDLGLPSERIGRFTAAEAARRSFSPLNVVLVQPQEVGSAAGDAPLFGIADDAFSHQRGLITKREVRAVVLALLQLRPGQVLWDLGAGSGAVSVEAARLTPLRSVWAVEKVPERAAVIRENVRRFHCGEIQVVEGDALEQVDRLPDPDRVFVGGGGAHLPALLEKVRTQVRPGGRMVLTSVTFQSFARVQDFSRAHGLSLEAVQIQVSRAVPIGDTSRWEALNPVTVCAMDCPVAP
ncbi:precorrin-6Y C5,15-methyltransferase (decarboxylating) [Desulfacinum hydrothermale DSM 13146]|uniref:Precorrin-6Y C5,15-methyltransferase (Decarboxylating) n=1 Tax=Desulfacinum hydrothermale DSM 13146 TaxID=1121390 RepID=A0A1W1WXV3_9BACT|nr:precorrin-6y C5,15-methyltransferase (decarboxylating) subunit CbiE [Desulfacinum hydrothermale]SMC16437.1 precorrin-6Y C5,15-methyltransferase (decarboxylating) [Desulfacinum hydrothermale DSM 13146]